MPVQIFEYVQQDLKKFMGTDKNKQHLALKKHLLKVMVYSSFVETIHPTLCTSRLLLTVWMHAALHVSIAAWTSFHASAWNHASRFETTKSFGRSQQRNFENC